MSKNDAITAEEAQAAIMDARTEREGKAREAIQKILDKHDCRLSAVMVIQDDKIIPQVLVVVTE